MDHYKILVIEDFEEFRHFVVSTLRQRAEFQVIYEASDGLEGVQNSEKLQPDLILLDIGLPGLNGIEVARRVRRLAPSAKILFLSQESSADVVQEALDLAEGYVHKLSAESDLLPAILSVLRGERFVSSSLKLDANRDVRRRHEILVCSDEEVLLAGLTRFIGDALNAGNAAVVWATESHRHSLLQRLRAQGVDIDAAIQRGTYCASDVSEPPDPERILATIQSLSEAAFQMGNKHPRVAACGERAGQYWAEGNLDAALSLERLLNMLAGRCDLDILCIYPSPQDREESVSERICAEHTAIYYR